MHEVMKNLHFDKTASYSSNLLTDKTHQSQAKAYRHIVIYVNIHT